MPLPPEKRRLGGNDVALGPDRCDLCNGGPVIDKFKGKWVCNACLNGEPTEEYYRTQIEHFTYSKSSLGFDNSLVSTSNHHAKD